MPRLKKFFDLVTAKWNLIAEFATWVLTVASSFITAPPQRSYFELGNSRQFSIFFIASLSAIIFIPILKSGKKKYKTWYNTSIALLCAAIFLIVSYNLLLDKYSARFYDTSLIKGSTMFPEMKAKKDSLEHARQAKIPDEEFIKMCQGKVDYIWPEAELNARFYVLTTIYILTTALVGAFIISIIQATRCYQMKS